MALRLIGATPERITVKHRYSGLPLDALVIGGGNDIGPEHYGGDIQEKIKTDPERDRLEMQWINEAFTNEIPLLGICRGAQLINVLLGGTLHQDIRDMRKLTRNRPSLMPTKNVTLTP
ncbi:MAG: gamma-glutamyl-gamma-aminobutyrate hydrolase family protein, partial [Oleibacter sp.]|nr:gamma-glutamyl-gamma-aminobutyrate hydrolase family protein [Thalassolituus sp.]